MQIVTLFNQLQSKKLLAANSQTDLRGEHNLQKDNNEIRSKELFGKASIEK